MIFSIFPKQVMLTYRSRRIPSVLLGLAGICSVGCGGKQVRVRPWHGNINVRPNLPGSTGVQQENTTGDAPELVWNFPAPPTILSLPRQPARPRVQQSQPAESGEAQRPSAPSLAPQLSAQEIASAQLQLNDSSVIAQKNLETAKGHRLSAAQADLASKVTSFLQESKDAAREGDWTRARNLAKKAQVLSEELAASL